MYPSIFVSEDFFENYDYERKLIPRQNSYENNLDEENKIKSLTRIKDLFLASNIYSDIADKSLVKYHTKKFGTYDNFKDFVLHNKITNASFVNRPELVTRKSKSDCNKSGLCYFTNNDSEGCDIETKETGKIVLGKEFLKSPFFLEHTFAAETTNEQIFQIQRVKHHCSGIIIMDRYLFDDIANQPSKVKNLISFLNEIVSKDLNKLFEIDIITENKANNILFDAKFNEILDAFPNKISLHIYTPKKIDPDRYLITNYSVFSVGHLFMAETSVSCNFIPSNISVESIKKSYQIWKEKVQLAYKIINRTPESIGLIKSIWKSDVIEHSIFNL